MKPQPPSVPVLCALNPQVFTFLTYLQDFQKKESGQNQASRGEIGGGVTAASAIQALQDAGSKVTRMHSGEFQTEFGKLVRQTLWLIAQYYKEERVDSDHRRDQVRYV